jgi:hypothetical protein
MRQYTIVTSTPDSPKVVLKPIIMAGMYNIPEVRAAVKVLEENATIEFIGVRLGVRFYGLAVTTADELKENHFKLKDVSNGEGE